MSLWFQTVPLARLLASVGVALSLNGATVSAETREVLGHHLDVQGIRIAKSGSARQVLLGDDTFRITERPIYLPAGSRLLVFRRYIRDTRTTLQWGLALTDTGLLVWVRTDGTHYFEPSFVDRLLSEHEFISVAQARQSATTEAGEQLNISPSMVFPVDGAPADMIGLMIDAHTAGESVTIDSIAHVAIDDFAILTRSSLDVSDFAEPFHAYDPVAEARRIVESVMEERQLSREVRARVFDLLDQRFIAQKRCEEVVNYETNFGGGFEIDFNAILSPVGARLGITGNYNSNTVLPRGESFTFSRYRRDDNVIEIQERDLYDDRCAERQERLLVVSESPGVIGIVDPKGVADIALQVNAAGDPVYTCRDEYLRLINLLTRQYSLQYDTAALVVAQHAEFRGARDAATCEMATS